MKRTGNLHKEQFIIRMSLLLTVDKKSEVKKIKYVVRDGDEFAEITFNGDHYVVLKITNRTCGEICKIITRAVYGE